MEADESATTGPCAQYAIDSLQQASNYTGGPCFLATATYAVQSKADPSQRRTVVGTVDEARHIAFAQPIGQRWDDDDAQWLCLQQVEVLQAPHSHHSQKVAVQ